MSALILVLALLVGKVGDAAPDFKLPGTDGKTYTLQQFRGKQWVVLNWYPKAMTGGCTMQCQALSDSYHALRDYPVAVFGISVDTPELNREFAQKNGYKFPLLSDPSRSVAKAYGVLMSEGGVAARRTFLIDPEGRIRSVIEKVDTARAGEQLLAELKRLGVK